MKKIVNELKKIQEVRSIYHYKPASGEVVVVVVDSLVDSIFQCRGASKKRIILTIADIYQGKDVFDLNYIHISKRSELLYGEDLLGKNQVDKSYLRQQIESVARHLMIDMREQLMCPSPKRDSFQKHCYNILDRMIVGILVMTGQDIPPLADIKKEIVKLEHVLHVELDILRDLTEGKKRNTDECNQAHDLLLALTNKINTIGV